jgi:hypothetical protein
MILKTNFFMVNCCYFSTLFAINIFFNYIIKLTKIIEFSQINNMVFIFFLFLKKIGII